MCAYIGIVPLDPIRTSVPVLMVLMLVFYLRPGPACLCVSSLTLPHSRWERQGLADTTPSDASTFSMGASRAGRHHAGPNYICVYIQISPFGSIRMSVPVRMVLVFHFRPWPAGVPPPYLAFPHSRGKRHGKADTTPV